MANRLRVTVSSDLRAGRRATGSRVRGAAWAGLLELSRVAADTSITSRPCPAANDAVGREAQAAETVRSERWSNVARGA